MGREFNRWREMIASTARSIISVKRQATPDSHGQYEPQAVETMAGRNHHAAETDQVRDDRLKRCHPVLMALRGISLVEINLFHGIICSLSGKLPSTSGLTKPARIQP